MPELANVALALFAKAPRPGTVKTRLAPALGSAGAAEFHRLCVFDMWQRLGTVSGSRNFLYCDRPCEEFERLSGQDRFRLQRGADLGERMCACLKDMLAEGFGSALIVGSDAPALPLAQIGEALDALKVVDIGLGPSDDGGFTLIAARRTHPEMFAGVLWSRSDTRAATARAIRQTGLTIAETSTWAYDVDCPADLRRLARDPCISTRMKAWLDHNAADRSQKFVEPGLA